MLCARLKIYFAIGLVSCYQNNPGSTYWHQEKEEAVKRIFHHLCGISNMVLCYQGGTLD